MAADHPALAWAQEQAQKAASSVKDAMSSEQLDRFVGHLATAILENLDARKRVEREITLDALARDSGARRAEG
ncbi:hypothetical protein [Methylobacterium radiodurans]|uniref:Uncharacterized protein n=1 Tax=Methylobacterium radiodurans TaxID=2202828 RepID=A0A2U8VS50_9HYPH|nr:hypothetical protein [Methylobacterium radiodurans]AWN36527.1 hypothetical protein DK427_12965 [Methylobacterium radiodurans]